MNAAHSGAYELLRDSGCICWIEGLNYHLKPECRLRFILYCAIESMGRKKFRLIARKNEKCALAKPVLTVSVPRSKLPVESIDGMSAQLSLALPPPWIAQAAGFEQADRRIILCQLDTTTLAPTLRHSITIRSNFTWLLSVHGKNISPQSCRVLAASPSLLNSVDRVVQLISLIEQSRICEGNSESKFLDVAKRRDGVFKDQSGKLYSIIAVMTA